MGFVEDLARHAEQIVSRRPHIKGEEATKHALVVPFLQVLGYDVFDPREVQPEYIADFAKKTRGGQLEKIDYAIWKDGGPVLFVECKTVGDALEDSDGQLSRYFNATPSVRVGILTDGLRLRAFTDLQQPNIMDPTPFLDVDLTSLKPPEIEALRMFHKLDMSSEKIQALAEEMVYFNALTRFISAQLRDPSENFVRYVAGEVQSFGRVTQRVVDRITPILRKAIQSAIVENVARSFEPGAPSPQPVQPVPAPPPVAVHDATVEPSSPDIVTTEEEIQCMGLIEQWVHVAHPNAPVVGRDSRTYYAVHQGNVRKWFVRFNMQKPPFWMAFRHVAPEEIRASMSDVNVADGGQFGDSKVMVASTDGVTVLKPFVMLAFEREMNRVDQADRTAPA